MVPLFPYFVYKDNVMAAVSVFLLAGSIDIADGFIARKFNMITDIGKVYDPFVDKLMQLTVLVSISVAQWIPAFAVWIIVAKELAMIVTGAILYRKKIVVYSSWFGKAGTVIFYTIIFSLIIFRHTMPEIIKNVLLWLLVAVMIAVAIGYLMNFLKTDKYQKNKQA